MSPFEPGARLALLAAMQPELRPIVRRLGLRPGSLGRRRVWRGRAGSHEVAALVTSMGTRAATDGAIRLLDARPCDHVVVVGIAGGVAPQLRIGDLLNPQSVVDEASGATHHPTPIGDDVPSGRLLTTDTLHDSPEALLRLRREGFLAVDMETAAVGAVAEARGLPWSVFRAISDLAGDPAVGADVVGLARADGTPDPGAVARMLLTRPWRVPRLITLGRGMRRAIRVSTGAFLDALR